MSDYDILPDTCTHALLVTETSTGIGRALAEIALERGEIVIATARSPASLQVLTQKYPSTRLLVLPLDIRSRRRSSYTLASLLHSSHPRRTAFCARRLQPRRRTYGLGQDFAPHGPPWGDALSAAGPRLVRQLAPREWRGVRRAGELGAERYHQGVWAGFV